VGATKHFTHNASIDSSLAHVQHSPGKQNQLTMSTAKHSTTPGTLTEFKYDTIKLILDI